MRDRPEQLVTLAQAVADERPAFFDIKGPGKGDKATNQFMAILRDHALAQFGQDFAERRICGANRLSVDFYFRDEKTIVEVALSLRNPSSEFDRDILKALIAKEARCPVKRLLFISKPGARKRCSQPGARAIVDWVERAHGIEIEIHELQRASSV